MNERLRAYNKSPAGKASRKRYTQTARGKATAIAATNRQRAKHPERYRARYTAWNAIVSGELERPDDCSRCGEHVSVEAHHADYGKPLDVEWLCHRCHHE